MNKLMNRALTGIAAASMIASMGGMSVFASDTKDVTLTYTPTASYEWSVPASSTIDAEEETKQVTISVSNRVLASGKVVKITNSKLTLTNPAGTDSLTPAASLSGGTDVTNGGTVLTAGTGSAAVEETITYDLSNVTAQYADTYTGTVTFTASIENAT